MISAIDLSALQGVESLLRQRIGLAPESLGTAIIQDAVQLRMRARHISDWSAFEHLVREDLIAFQELVEQIVVPETWFFRDLTPFDCLRFFVRTWKNADPPRAGQRLRLLSVPCSTGEEAYSLAIALLDEGLNAAQFQVEGVDISRPTLRRAREATYGENSFRQAAPPLLVLRERYFRRRETQYEVCDEVRRSVNFQLDNLASPRFLAGAPSFDVIFCRNLLIYLDAPARRTALAHFQRLLAPGGLLYVGHVEGAVVSAGDWQHYHADFPFAFVRRSTAKPDPHRLSAVGYPSAATPLRANEVQIPISVAVAAQSNGPTTLALGSEQVGRLNNSPSAAVAGPQRAAVPQPHLSKLQAARAAADQGQLALAASLCEQLLHEHALVPDIHCLLGVVRHAAGDLAQAEQLFQKTLFLNPRHPEALAHLMLLASGRGDVQAAAQFQRRLQTAKK